MSREADIKGDHFLEPNDQAYVIYFPLLPWFCREIAVDGRSPRVSIHRPSVHQTILAGGRVLFLCFFLFPWTSANGRNPFPVTFHLLKNMGCSPGVFSNKSVTA